MKIIIRPSRAPFSRPFCPSRTKETALRIANEVWTRVLTWLPVSVSVFVSMCVCVCVFCCAGVWVCMTTERPAKMCLLRDVIKSFLLRFSSFSVGYFSVGVSFTLTSFHPVSVFGHKISKWNCCIICTFRIFICVCTMSPQKVFY